MSDFIIPKGRDFNFTVKVIEADSFLAQDLTYMLGTPTMKLALKAAPDTTVHTINMSVLGNTASTGTTEVQQVTLVTVDDQVTTGEVFTLLTSGVTTTYTAVENDTAAIVATALISNLGDIPNVNVAASGSAAFTLTATAGYPIFSVSSITTNMYVSNTVEGVEAIVSVTSDNALNGLLEGSMSTLETSELTYDRGPAEDAYYLKANYIATIEVQFTEASNIPNIITVIEDVYVTPTGA